MAEPQTGDTSEQWYTDRLKEMDAKESLAKRLHTVMYRKHIRNLVVGRVLDVGCGIGMNLRFMSADSVGVDHNEHSVAVANESGLIAFVPDDLHAKSADFAGSFDTILAAHVVEHMDRDAGIALLNEYLPYLKPKARIVLITPQEGGYKTDPTHVRFVDFDGSRDLLETVGLRVTRSASFPIPRSLGKQRRGNEFVVVGER